MCCVPSVILGSNGLRLGMAPKHSLKALGTYSRYILEGISLSDLQQGCFMLRIRDDEAEQDWVFSTCTVKWESQQDRKHKKQAKDR